MPNEEAMSTLSALGALYLKLSVPIGRRGFRTFMSVLTRLLPEQARAVRSVVLDEGQVFSFPAGDAYWQYYFLGGIKYEKEIETFIHSMPKPPDFFIDGGANFGFWSVFMSRTTKTVAIEASSTTLEMLQLNNRTNGNRFTVEHAALSDKAGAEISFSKSLDHASRSIVDSQSNNVERVVTTTVDQIIDRHYVGDGPIVVKLDVEGVEVAAFEGAKHAFEHDSIFIYEDHGNDMTCRPTAYLLERGKRVYAISKQGVLKQVFSIDEVRVLKTNPRVGYNFAVLGDLASPPKIA